MNPYEKLEYIKNSIYHLLEGVLKDKPIGIEGDCPKATLQDMLYVIERR